MRLAIASTLNMLERLACYGSIPLVSSGARPFHSRVEGAMVGAAGFKLPNP
jgi:hypothetical protein